VSPGREALHRLPFTLPDSAVILGALALPESVAGVGDELA
jgi:hypothetical protein